MEILKKILNLLSKNIYTFLCGLIIFLIFVSPLKYVDPSNDPVKIIKTGQYYCMRYETVFSRAQTASTKNKAIVMHHRHYQSSETEHFDNC